MLGSYVCRQCRAHLRRRILPVRTPHWQSRATIVSFRKIPTGQTEAAQSEAQPQEDQLEDERHSRPGRRDPNGGTGPRGRYSGLVDRAEKRAPPEHLLDVVPQSSGIETPQHQGGPAVAIKQALDARDKKGSVDEAWALFEENYTSRDCEALTNPHDGDLALLKNGQIFTELLQKVNGALCNAPGKYTTTPTKVLFKYEQLGLATPELWSRTTLPYLTQTAMFIINAPSTNSKNLPSILSELLSLWRLFFQCRGRNPQLDSISKEWNLPKPEEMPISYSSKDFNLRMQDYHPAQIGNTSLGFLAVYFYTLSDALSTIETLYKEAEPFIQFLQRILADSSVVSVYKYPQNSAGFKKLPKQVQAEILKEIDTAPYRALEQIAAQGATMKNPTSSPETNLELFQLRRIARAVLSKQSSSVLDVLWNDIQRMYTNDGSPAIPRRIYNAFLSGYLSLFASQRSVEVWNHMIAHGVQPDLQSWIALLQGCETAKDYEGFDAIWKRMLNTGIEPDNYAWTTRVHGLFGLRKIDEGLAALDDMGRRWLFAENAINLSDSKRKGAKRLPTSAKAANKCTKPSIEVINGAVSALAQLPLTAIRQEKRVGYVQKILGWAGNFSIKPDAITYNSLIQLYLRAGDYSTAFKILRQMEKEGIAADIATHTLLITASFDNGSFAGLTAAQQTQKIISVLDSLEAGGIKLNDHAYSIAIDRMLKTYGNHKAVNSIMQYMQARNRALSAHAYVSLITYMFQQSPPPMPAIDSMVDTFFTSHRVSTDQYLFDRTIEGYASHGETSKMMSVLSRMRRLGALPGWQALTTIIEALYKDGETVRARQIVREVEGGEGVGKAGVVGGRAGENRFFHTAQRLGLYGEHDGREDGDMDRGMGRMDDFVVSDALSRGSQNEQPLETHQERQQEQEIPQSRPDAPLYQERAPAPSADEEDVHGFLTDDYEDTHPKANRQ
ncbi:hypothetical protein HBI56_158290 [Parastagonospora nodorum]|nr:hypothetical protein HBH53_024170 [Parastagonospora nodorum]KAH3967832.1 hypothetical protein HBH52_184290 [Parastagonospora nodorum]KAH3994578.1 hypothetical protein HBI10_183930 [Parastagonospora nodorum]KAH4014090.1 hypothetical protein HBI13_176030 [Parastagonospora nodorum]KAH4073775.1 hypothetical protein HBH50_038120 [Parastagonospora nodorum]